MAAAWKSVHNRRRPRQWTFEETYVWAAQWRTKERSKCLHVAHRCLLQIPGCVPNGSWRRPYQPLVPGKSRDEVKENASPPDDRWNLSLLSVQSLHSLATVPLLYVYIRDLGITRHGSQPASFTRFQWIFFVSILFFHLVDDSTRSIQSTRIFSSRWDVIINNFCKILDSIGSLTRVEQSDPSTRGTKKTIRGSPEENEERSRREQERKDLWRRAEEFVE